MCMPFYTADVLQAEELDRLSGLSSVLQVP